MKRVKSAIIVLALSTASTTYADVMTKDQLDGLFKDANISPESLIENFSQYSVEDNMVIFLQEVAKQRTDIFTNVLVLAFLRHPDYIDLIVSTAREADWTNEEITIAAIEAGIDPTIIAEATAGGTETVVNSPVPNIPTKKNPISAN